MNPDSLTVSHATILPTPPPEDAEQGDATAAAETEKQKRLETWRNFRDEATLDFAAFEGSISRIQFLLTSNEKERERYAAEKLKILSTMQTVRDNTSELRGQLEEAQRALALRKSYDALADKITSNRLLKPRGDQQANLQKLRTEITELEEESKEYAKTWAERREQFGRIVEEGMQLRRLIRDEKEEVERREGMLEGREGDEADVPSKGKSSGANTPRQEPETVTPSQHSLVAEKASTVPGAASPLRQSTTVGDEKTPQEDTAMVDEGEVTGEDGSGQPDDLEEGEEVSDDRAADRMDIT